MAGKCPVTLVLGAANIGDKTTDTLVRFDTPDEVNSFFEPFLARGYNQIDSARGYAPHSPGSCEPRLGAVDVANRFIVDTKVFSKPGDHSKEGIASSLSGSLEALKMSQVNIMYLHAPDRKTPFEETCEAMDKGYREGKFKHFGLSNYTAEDVTQIVEICERRGFVKPTAYQGQYNPVFRSIEKDLFPVLRKHGIPFYAYSPAGGGFFAGNHRNPTAGSRFDSSHRIGGMYVGLYDKPHINAATDKALEAAAKHGIGGHAAALRWTLHHGALDSKYGDAIIIGASSPAQLISNLDIVEQGPLPDDVVEAMEELDKELAKAKEASAK